MLYEVIKQPSESLGSVLKILDEIPHNKSIKYIGVRDAFIYFYLLDNGTLPISGRIVVKFDDSVSVKIDNPYYDTRIYKSTGIIRLESDDSLNHLKELLIKVFTVDESLFNGDRTYNGKYFTQIGSSIPSNRSETHTKG